MNMIKTIKNEEWRSEKQFWFNKDRLFLRNFQKASILKSKGWLKLIIEHLSATKPNSVENESRF